MSCCNKVTSTPMIGTTIRKLLAMGALLEGFMMMLVVASFDTYVFEKVNTSVS